MSVWECQYGCVAGLYSQKMESLYHYVDLADIKNVRKVLAMPLSCALRVDAEEIELLL